MIVCALADCESPVVERAWSVQWSSCMFFRLRAFWLFGPRAVWEMMFDLRSFLSFNAHCFSLRLQSESESNVCLVQALWRCIKALNWRIEDTETVATFGSVVARVLKLCVKSWTKLVAESSSRLPTHLKNCWPVLIQEIVRQGMLGTRKGQRCLQTGSTRAHSSGFARYPSAPLFQIMCFLALCWSASKAHASVMSWFSDIYSHCHYRQVCGLS